MCYSLRGICVQSEHWDGVAVSDHDKHEWLEMTKSVWTTCEVFFCTSVAKASMCYSSLCLFRVCWWCAIDIEIAQNPQMLTNVFVCVQIVCHFFFHLDCFLDHCSSFFITLNKQTCYSMISLTLTYHQHTITISFTPNQRQKCSSNEKVAHDGFKHHEYQTRKHETRQNNSE